MQLEELINNLEEAWRLHDGGDEFVENAEDADIIRQNTAHDVLVYLRAIQVLDRKGNMTTDTAPSAYGMFNVLRVLWDLGLNDNMHDPGAGDYADQLAGHLQEAFESGRRGRTE